MKKSGHLMIDREQLERKELDELHQAIIDNPMLYPLVDDFYIREQTNRGKAKLRCKQSQICFNQEIIKNVVRFRCSSRFYEKCQAYFSTDLKMVFILNEKLEHTCSQDQLYRQEKTKTRIEIEKAVHSFNKKLQQKQTIPYKDHDKFFKRGENFVSSDYISSESDNAHLNSSSSNIAPEDHCDDCKQKALHVVQSAVSKPLSSDEEDISDESYEQQKIKPNMIGKKRLAVTNPMILEETIMNPVTGDNIKKPQQKEDIGTALVIESKSLLNLIEGSIQNSSNQPLEQQTQQQQQHRFHDQKSLESTDMMNQSRSKVIFKVIVEGCEFVIKGAEWSIKQL